MARRRVWGPAAVLHGAFRSAAVTLRWMVIHMVEETGRHLGHLDAIRELVDGTRGYH